MYSALSRDGFSKSGKTPEQEKTMIEQCFNSAEGAEPLQEGVFVRTFQRALGLLKDSTRLPLPIRMQRKSRLQPGEVIHLWLRVISSAKSRCLGESVRFTTSPKQLANSNELPYDDF
jgi:hypothetical protein